MLAVIGSEAWASIWNRSAIPGWRSHARSHQSRMRSMLSPSIPAAGRRLPARRSTAGSDGNCFQRSSQDQAARGPAAVDVELAFAELLLCLWVARGEAVNRIWGHSGG